MFAALLLGTLLAAAPADVPIHRIQGAGHASPLVGETVETEGVVVASTVDDRSGEQTLWIVAPADAWDDRVETSEGLAVVSRDTRDRALAVGDLVGVRGVVEERAPGRGTLSITTLASRSISIVNRSVPLPPLVTWGGADGLAIPSTAIDDDGLTTFDVTGDALDFFEAHEGMRVRLVGARSTSPRTKYGEITVVLGDDVETNARGALVMTPTSSHPMRAIVDDVLVDLPRLHTGTPFTSDIVGVVHASFGAYKVLATEAPSAAPSTLERETSEVPDELLRVATFNVENLDARDDPEHFARLAELVVAHLGSPDLIGVQEIQDDDGPECDGEITSAAATWAMLIDAIVAAGGPRYDWTDIAPRHRTDGGQPCGNIRVGYLWNPASGLSLVRRPGGDATTDVAVLSRGGRPQLSVSPGRIGATDPSFENSRKPLAAEFRRGDRTLFAVCAHLRSKGGDDSLFGPSQPPVRRSEPGRVRQAEAVARFVDDVLEVDPDAAIVVMGDMNDFPHSAPLRALAGERLVSLIETLPPGERYTYVYQGVAQVLDHVLISKGLHDDATVVDVVHVNAEFADQASDHDPMVVGVSFRE